MSIFTGVSNEMAILFDETAHYFDDRAVNVTENKPYYKDVSMEFGNVFSYRFNITTTNNTNNDTQQFDSIALLMYNLSIPINSLFLSFKSYQFIDDTIDTPITGVASERRHFLLSPGQLYTIFFNPTIKDDVLALNLQLEQIPIELESDKIQIEIYPRSYPIMYRSEETKQYGGKYIRLCLKFFLKII